MLVSSVKILFRRASAGLMRDSGLLTPSVGKYLFDSGSTVFLGCGFAAFTYTAFFSKSPAVTVPATAVPTLTIPGTTTSPKLGLATNPGIDSTPTPATASPSQSATPSKFSSTTTITIIIVGAVSALVGGLVFLWFLYLAWKIHHKAKYPQQQYSPLPYQYSSTSLQSVPPVEKSGLSKWALIATIVSPIFAIVGLVVAIYFGLKQQK